jgi:hypothetical protein
MTCPELVDQVRCYGWIDGVRKSIDDERSVLFDPFVGPSNSMD